MMRLRSPNRSQASCEEAIWLPCSPTADSATVGFRVSLQPQKQDEFRRNRKAVSQIKPITGDTANRDDDSQGAASPGVPDVDVGVHRAGDQNLGLKPGPVQVTEDTHSSSSP